MRQFKYLLVFMVLCVFGSILYANTLTAQPRLPYDILRHLVLRISTTQTTAPTVNDYNYRLYTTWLDETTDYVYILVDNTPGAAVWSMTNFGGGGTLDPDDLTGDNIDDNKINADIIETKAVISGATEIPTGDDVYDFCETTQAYYNSITDLPTGIPDDSADTTHVALCSSTFNEFALHSGTSDVVSGATNSALAWVPAATNNLLAMLTGIESDPVILVISETGAVHGDRKIIYNAGTIEIQIGTIDTQQEVVSGNTIYLPQQGIAEIIYVTDRWAMAGHESNKISVKSIETPTHLTSELNDTTSPHVLLTTEICNSYLTNLGIASGTTTEYRPPAAAEGWSFGAIVGVAGGGMIIRPNGAEQWYLNGTIQEAGEALEIEETVADVMESIWCECIASGVTQIVGCESKYSDWEGEND